MDKKELTKLLKPLIKKCVKEVLMEEQDQECIVILPQPMMGMRDL